MTKQGSRRWWTIVPSCAALFAGAGALGVEASGPLYVLDGKPVIWADHEVRGGSLNSQTVAVDKGGKRTVFYRVDAGALGPLSHADGVRIADRIFGEYSGIPTADIEFVNAGPIRDPDTGLPMDVDGTNFGKVLQPTFQNPIIFDSDGSITGGGGVLGAFGVIAFEPDGSAVTEGVVILNGSALDPPLLSTTSFLGVFTHEFGHFAGPLDHQQINGSIASHRFDAALPEGMTFAQAYDLFGPFTETLHPFLIGAPAGSTVGFPDSGFFIATMDLDTKNGLSSLYPNSIYRLTRGSIDGEVFFRSGKDKVPVPGMNVVARRVSRGPYPPPNDTVAYPTPPPLDADGVPAPPPARNVTDSLATAASAVTGLDFGYGGYRIQGLPLGAYEVMLQDLFPFFIGGSRVGPLPFQLPLPYLESYFNRPTTSLDVRTFTPVLAIPAVTTPKVDIEILGLNSSEPKSFEESDPHFTKATAIDLGTLPARVAAESAVGDPFAVQIDFGGGITSPLHDLYKFTLTAPFTIVYITLEPKADVGDLDLFLLRSNFGSPLVPFAQIPRYSFTASAREIIGAFFGPGTWYLGVSAFAGDVKYHLRVVPWSP
jgi:hypothetical protein